MGTSFNLFMGIIGGISAINLFNAKAQKKSKARTFGIWFNVLAFAFIIVAIIIALFIK